MTISESILLSGGGTHTVIIYKNLLRTSIVLKS